MFAKLAIERGPHIVLIGDILEYFGIYWNILGYIVCISNLLYIYVYIGDIKTTINHPPVIMKNG